MVLDAHALLAQVVQELETSVGQHRSIGDVHTELCGQRVMGVVRRTQEPQAVALRAGNRQARWLADADRVPDRPRCPWARERGIERERRRTPTKVAASALVATSSQRRVCLDPHDHTRIGEVAEAIVLSEDARGIVDHREVLTQDPSIVRCGPFELFDLGASRRWTRYGRISALKSSVSEADWASESGAAT